MSGIEIKEYKLYLFDMDGTLTETISRNTFPQSIEDRRFIDGRWEHLMGLNEKGKHTAIVSNQGGAAWGLVHTQEMDEYLRRLCRQADIDAFYVCYRDTGPKAISSDRTIKELTVPEYYKEWDRRKPGPGMLIEAMDNFGVSREETLMIGDRKEDEGAAISAGVDFQWSWDYFKEGPLII